MACMDLRENSRGVTGQARTMYRMVDEAPDGKKLVFFNNRQASLFSMENIETLLEAFTIETEPKLVIRLLPSSCGSETLAFMSERVKQVMASERDETYGERLKEAVKVPVPAFSPGPCIQVVHFNCLASQEPTVLRCDARFPW
jgi:hypothetical protein